MDLEGLWDDCDRVGNVVLALMNDREKRDSLSKTRVYVDEVQDYTQAEIALFFLLCQKGGLFLAGDPAQAVVEGVEFRFDDVRGVPHYLYPGDRRYIPDKPLSVTLNFRSHTGILNVAAQVRHSVQHPYLSSLYCHPKLFRHRYLKNCLAPFLEAPRNLQRIKVDFKVHARYVECVKLYMVVAVSYLSSLHCTRRPFLRGLAHPSSKDLLGSWRGLQFSQ